MAKDNNKNQNVSKLLAELQRARQQVKELEVSLSLYHAHADLDWQIKELYQNLIHILPDAIILTDVKGTIIMVNKRAATMYGFPKMEGMIGKKVVEFIGDTDQARARNDIDRLMKGEVWRSEEYNTCKQDGSQFVVEVSASIIRSRTGDPQAFIIVVREITERKRMEEALRASEEQYRTTLDSMGEAIHVVDKDLKIVLFNITFRRWTAELGLDTQDVIGQGVFEVFPFLPSEVYDEYQQVFDKKEVVVSQEDVKIGERRFITETRKIPVLEGDRVVRVVTVVNDITERTYLDELKDEFITTVSHELRTPLAVIKSGVNLLLERIPGQLNIKQGEVLSLVRDNADKMVRVITDLLTLANFNTGKVQLRKSVFDLVALIKELEAHFKKYAEQKGIEFKMHFPKKRIEIFADRERIKIVFTNLLGNAVKFTPEGHIDVFVVDSKRNVECIVADTGVGIAQSELTEAFRKPQLFSRVAEKEREQRGLGLAITKRIVDMHNGSILTESKPGKGTKFVVILPKSEPRPARKD